MIQPAILVVVTGKANCHLIENNTLSHTLKNTERNGTDHKLRLKGYMEYLSDALLAIKTMFRQLNPNYMSEHNGFAVNLNAVRAQYPGDHPIWLLWGNVCDYIMHHLVYANATDQSYAAGIGEIIHFLRQYEDKFLKDTSNNPSDQVLKSQTNLLSKALLSAQSILNDEFISDGSVALLADIKSISTKATRQVQTVLSAFTLKPDIVYSTNVSTWITLYEKNKNYDHTLDVIKDNKTAPVNPMIKLVQDSQAVINNELTYPKFKNRMPRIDDNLQLEYNDKTPPVFGQGKEQVKAVLGHIIPLLDKMTCLTALLSTDKVAKKLEIDVTKVSAMVAEAKKEVDEINQYIQQVEYAYDTAGKSKINSGFKAFSDLGKSVKASFELLDKKLSELKTLMEKLNQDGQKNIEQEYQDILYAYGESLDSIGSRRSTRFYSMASTDELESHKVLLGTAKEMPSFYYKGIQLIKVFDSVGGKNNRKLDSQKINYSGIYATNEVIEVYQYTYQEKNRNRASWCQFLNSDQGEQFRKKVFFVKTPNKSVELFAEVVSGQAVSQIMQHTNADQQTVIVADLVTIKEGIQGVIQPYDSVSEDLHKGLGTSKNEDRYLPYEWWNPKVYEDYILKKSEEGYCGLSEALFYPQLVYNYSNHSGNMAINDKAKKFISRDQGGGLKGFGYLQLLMEEFKNKDKDNYTCFERGQFDRLISANGELHNPYLEQWSVVDRKESLYAQMYKQVVRRYYQPINGLMMSVYGHAFSLNMEEGIVIKKQFIDENSQLIKNIIGESEELSKKITKHTGISGLPDAQKYAENLYETIKHHARFMQLEFYRHLKQQNIAIDDSRFQSIIQSGKDESRYITSLLDNYKKVMSIKQHLVDSTQTSIKDKARIYEVLQDKTRLEVLLNILNKGCNFGSQKIYRSGIAESSIETGPAEVLNSVLSKMKQEQMNNATMISLCQKINGIDRFQEKASSVLDLDKNDLKALLLVALAKQTNTYLSAKTTTTGAQIKALVNADQGYRNLFKGYLGVTTDKAGDVIHVPYRALRDYAVGKSYALTSSLSDIDKHQALEEMFCLGYGGLKSKLVTPTPSNMHISDLNIHSSSTVGSTNNSVDHIQNYKEKFPNGLSTSHLLRSKL